MLPIFYFFACEDGRFLLNSQHAERIAHLDLIGDENSPIVTPLGTRMRIFQ